MDNILISYNLIFVSMNLGYPEYSRFSRPLYRYLRFCLRIVGEPWGRFRHFPCSRCSHDRKYRPRLRSCGTRGKLRPDPISGQMDINLVYAPGKTRNLYRDYSLGSGVLSEISGCPLPGVLFNWIPKSIPCSINGVY